MSAPKNRFVRTHTCGQLSAKNLNQEVQLCGWVATRRDHGGVIFIDLRDRYGITQVVFDPTAQEAFGLADRARSEYVLWCKGKVRSRPDGMTNSKMETGEIEVICSDIKILSEAETPPFEISDASLEVNENVRLKYRYLDLRRPSLQKNLIIRHQLNRVARNYLSDQGFIEVETPILYKSTPEGARDFIVPSRLSPGSFYALPQSPQTLKQILMIGGMDRYFQIARAFRDEDLRADRQPEFTQIDIEASFIDEDELFPIMEGMFKVIWKEILNIELKTPFPRMRYKEAMNRYGSDKPDVRFGLELQDISKVFAQSQFKVFQAALVADSSGRQGSIRAINAAGYAEKFSRKDLDDLSALAIRMGAQGLLWIKVQENGEYQSPAAKFFSAEEKNDLQKALNLKPGDLVMIVADRRNSVACESLGSVRLEVGRKLGLLPKVGSPQDRENPAFLWVTHFPLVIWDEKDKRYVAAHHPFTSPQPEFFDDFINGRNMDNLEAAAYDMVLNGVELSSGSLRIYRPDVQAAMFKNLGLSDEEIRVKFGFFIDALKYGTPPHGGIAFGVDRLAAILCGVGPIRDVIAFPKTQKGTCLMSETPSVVQPEQLVDLGITLNEQKRNT